jgi:hypothetical protein
MMTRERGNKRELASIVANMVTSLPIVPSQMKLRLREARRSRSVLMWRRHTWRRCGSPEMKKISRSSPSPSQKTRLKEKVVLLPSPSSHPLQARSVSSTT